MKMRWNGIAWIFALAALGCGYRTQERVVSQADVAAGRTRLTNFMSSSHRPDVPAEQVPGSLSRSIVLDEASITRLAADHVCFALVIRSDSAVDAPLSEHAITVNGQRVAVDAETESVFEHPYDSERVVVASERSARDSHASFRMTEREQLAFRVHERRATVCGPRGRDGSERLELELSQPGGFERWGETFVWRRSGF